MAGVGHEDPFPRPGPNGRCRFGQETFAGVRGSGRDAPIPDLPPPALERGVRPLGRPLGEWGHRRQNDGRATIDLYVQSVLPDNVNAIQGG